MVLVFGRIMPIKLDEGSNFEMEKAAHFYALGWKVKVIARHLKTTSKNIENYLAEPEFHKLVARIRAEITESVKVAAETVVGTAPEAALRVSEAVYDRSNSKVGLDASKWLLEHTGVVARESDRKPQTVINISGDKVALLLKVLGEDVLDGSHTKKIDGTRLEKDMKRLE